ncbi:S-layer homology domain-containing protein [Anaerocellum diazotrophicum]|uniref:SLH domain-containing protein n=1 Tax=Caldicellulosiruptor diazotrophicus TaxID=2806205 RepID=A0ABM7NJS4_9FIRM|nr:S-layer homology domain-containing protein [Caldicellulosiruptor diazotrophicus]BCS80355.1 hypothetical protein CaldiYA01_03150 [Caldicellulosiruptor diazotrophicus]
MKRFKRAVSLVVVAVFLLANVLAFAATPLDNCKSTAKALLSQLVDKIKASGSAQQTAEVISKFISGSGRTALVNAFNQIAQGPGAAQRLESALGLNPTTLGQLLDWMASYQGGGGKNWFVNLVSLSGDALNSALDTAANDLVNKYVQTVGGDVYKAEYQLNKINAAVTLFNTSTSDLKPIKYDLNGNFNVYDTGFNNLFNLLNGVLGNQITGEENKANLRNAFQTIVNAVNSIADPTEKLGAKALLQALGLLYVESVPSTGGGTVPGTGGGTTTTQPTTSQQQQQTTQPAQQPSQQTQPTTTTELSKKLDEAIAQGNTAQIREVVNTLSSVLATVKNTEEAVSSLKEISGKVATALDKISDVSQVKSIVNGLTNAINVVAANVQKQSISNVEKSLKLESLKFEAVGLLLRAYEATAVTPQKSEDASKVTFKVSANDIALAMSKTNEIASGIQISNSVVKKSLNLVGVSVAINATSNKDTSVMFDKESIDKIKSDNKIANLLIKTQNASIVVPVSTLTKDKFELKITPKQISNSLSQAVDVNIVVGDNVQDKFDKPVVLLLKLNSKIADESKVSVYRVSDGKTEIVPGIYVSTTNSFLVERKSLSTYYVGNYNKTYSDVDSNAWYYKNVQLISAKGITDGYPDGTFRPNNNVTRAEFAKMVVETFQFDTSGQAVSKFEDVKESDWFYPYVATLYNLGIISGRSETEFVPNAPVTREEMAKMISLALVKVGKVSLSAIPTLNFTDDSSISTWAKKYVAVVVENGIMEGRGNNTFAPKANATRAEVATVIVRALVK